MAPSANEIAAQYERREREKAMAAHPSNGNPRTGDLTIWVDGDLWKKTPTFESHEVSVQINGNVLVADTGTAKEIFVLPPGAYAYFDYSDEGE